MHTLDAALNQLFSLAKRGARRGLEAMEEACAREGDPQDRLVVAHVAGTNGKGSVSASLESIARAAGLRTGLYTSPHLVRFAERIRIDGAPIEDAVLEHHLRAVLDRHPSLTFFEVSTLVAFNVFVEAKVELAVIEVGLGGRLDATNVVRRPSVTAITTIGYDHTELLGDTIESIAAEKAGILAPDAPIVTGELPRAASVVVDRRAEEVHAGPIWRVGQELTTTAHGQHLVVQGPGARSVSVTPALAGAHQRHNAAIAVGMAWQLRTFANLPLEDVAIARGIAQVRWAGRLEEIRAADGRYLLDGAHNEEGARALAAALDARPPEKRALVFGAMADKAWGTMIRELTKRFEMRIYVAPDAGPQRVPAAPNALAALDMGGVTSPSVDEGLRTARAFVGRDGLVVVAGSLYLVGEVRARLLGETRDPSVGL